MSDLWLGAFLGLMLYKLVNTLLAALFTSLEKTHTFTHRDTLSEMFQAVLFGALSVLTFAGVIL